MTRTNTKTRERKLEKKPEPRSAKNVRVQNKKLTKKKKKKSLNQKTSSVTKPDKPAVADASESESEPEPEPEKIQKLLEPCTKEQLIDFLIDAAVKDSALFDSIRDAADRDVSHRKIFVHGLAWGTSREDLLSAFEPYGEIENCTVVVDRNTGKTKGYGFVVFKHRKSASKALKQPQRMVNNRSVWCQLATVGPAAPAHDWTGRRIYVSNVKPDVDQLKLRAFFEKFGEIERGPTGFDYKTGKSRGFALFVYKTAEGAKKALEEPDKMFEGQKLNCRMATEGKNKNVVGCGAASVTTSVQPIQPEVLAAVAAAQQNMALFSQYQGFNPLYGNGFIGGAAGAVNPLMAAGGMGYMGQAGVVGGSGGSSGVGGPPNLSNFSGNTSSLDAQGGSNDMGLLHAYPTAQVGQASISSSYGTIGPTGDYKSF